MLKGKRFPGLLRIQSGPAQRQFQSLVGEAEFLMLQVSGHDIGRFNGGFQWICVGRDDVGIGGPDLIDVGAVPGFQLQGPDPAFEVMGHQRQLCIGAITLGLGLAVDALIVGMSATGKRRFIDSDNGDNRPYEWRGVQAESGLAETSGPDRLLVGHGRMQQALCSDQTPLVNGVECGVATKIVLQIGQL